MKYTTCTFYQCIILLYNVAQKSWLLPEQFNFLILVVACLAGAVNKTRIGLLGSDCGSDRTPDGIGLRIGSNRITDRIVLAIRFTFKVTLKVIAFWLL